MNHAEMMEEIKTVIMADMPDDAKVRDVMLILADNGYIPVQMFYDKREEVTARLSRNEVA